MGDLSHNEMSLTGNQKRAIEAIKGGSALICLNMDVLRIPDQGDEPYIIMHDDGSVEIRLKLVPGSAQKVHVYDSRFYGGQALVVEGVPPVPPLAQPDERKP